MKEMFTELRLKDYLIIALIFSAFVFIINLQSMVNKQLPKINLTDFETELIANIKRVKPLNQKLETFEGSKLKAIGYNIEIEYKIDSTVITKDLIVNYNVYEDDKNKIDKMVLSEDRLLPIRIKKMDIESVILNTAYNE